MPVMQVSTIQFKLYISEPLISNMHRKLQQTNPKHDISVFKPTTGISNLHKHFFSFHINEWVRICDCKGNCRDGLNQDLAGGPELIYYIK